MKTKIENSLLAIALLAGCAIVETAHAVDCDIVESFQNRSGALSLNDYKFQLADGQRKLLGGCESGVLSMLATNVATTTAIGDAVVSRSLSVNSEYKKFQTRFKIVAPPPTAGSSARSLVFREIRIHPQNSDTSDTPGVLRFGLYTYNGGASWTLSAYMQNRLNGSDTTFNFAGSPLTAASVFELQLDVTYEIAPYGRWAPKFKVTHFIPDTDTVIFSRVHHSLPYEMTPEEQRQGLLSQSGLVPNSEFKVFQLVPQ